MAHPRIREAMINAMVASSNLSSFIEKLKEIGKHYMSEEARKCLGSTIDEYERFIRHDLHNYIFLLETEYKKFINEKEGKCIYVGNQLKTGFWGSFRLDVIRYEKAFKSWLDMLEKGYYPGDIYLEINTLNFIKEMMNEVKKVLVLEY